MLHQLHIENYVLIEHLDLYFESGFSVLTGETGAGKSVLMGAIGLILGQRADLRVLKEGTERCVLEAEFTDIAVLKDYFDSNELEYDSTSCLIRRELYANGKSRAFVNDSPVSLTALKELGAQLVDIHSQHENLLLEKDTFQLEILDMVAKSTKELAVYQECYQAYLMQKKQVESLEEQLRKAQEEKDYIEFQSKQLEDAKLQKGEQESLEEEMTILTHTEEIKSGLTQIDDLLSEEDNGIHVRLKMAVNTADRLANVYPALKDAVQRMNACWLDMKDLSRDVDRWNNDIEIQPQRLVEIEERLSLLFELQKKHHVKTIDELIVLRDDLAAKMHQLTQSDDLLQEAKVALKKAEELAKEAAAKLSAKRKAVCSNMEKYVVAQLQLLGMPHGVFIVEILPKAMDIHGMDKVVFLFSANKNVAPQAITQIASGGEISRLMLTLKALVADVNLCSTLLFDEIDIGVSGEIAYKMGKMMRKIAANRQVICITHLPQIAANAKCHYKVYKSETGKQAISTAKILTEEEHIIEVAQMLSGVNVSEAAIQNARHLIYGES